MELFKRRKKLPSFLASTSAIVLLTLSGCVDQDEYYYHSAASGLKNISHSVEAEDLAVKSLLLSSLNGPKEGNIFQVSAPVGGSDKNLKYIGKVFSVDSDHPNALFRFVGSLILSEGPDELFPFGVPFVRLQDTCKLGILVSTSEGLNTGRAVAIFKGRLCDPK